MKITRVLEIIRPEYVYLRLKPSNSIRNNSTHKLARAIATLNRSLLHNIRREEQRIIKAFGKSFVLGTKYSYRSAAKVSYLIVLEKSSAAFYFIVPKHQLSFMREKIGDSWTGITIEEVKELPNFEKATQYQLVYEKEDALSLAADRRDNDLLKSNLNVIDVMEDGDRVGILYNFMPSSQHGWRHTYRHTIDSVKHGLPVERNKADWRYAAKYVLSLLEIIFAELGEVLSGKKSLTENNVLESLVDRLNGGRTVSEATLKKASATVLSTQIVVISQSADKVREHNTARSLAQSFDSISDDNRLKYLPLRKEIKFTDYSFGAEQNKVGELESQHMLSMPGRELLERYAFIDKVETQETQVPEELRKGVMCIGSNTYRGVEQLAYLSTDREYKNLTTVLIGPTRAGKTTLISNLSADAINNGECVVLLDFIKDCELSTDLVKTTDKVKMIDCGNLRTLPSMGYTEIGKSTDPLQQYENAKITATQLQTLVNAISTTDAPLTPKMKRYLHAAGLIVFINNGTIRNVFEVLQDHEIRHKFISRTKQERMSKYVQSLLEIDELNKGDVVGTKDTYVSGIVDRMNELEQNTYLETMLNKTGGDIDLAKEIQKNQLIVIRMPERAYPTDAEKDVICTYWMTKLWLALQVRGYQIDRNQHIKVNLVIDELYQVRTTERLLRDKLSRLAKFSLKPIISCHYLNQISGIRDELRSANASYMLISGCDKKNFTELASELYPFTEDDLLKLPRHHSLNLIKSAEGYARFITRLPWHNG